MEQLPLIENSIKRLQELRDFTNTDSHTYVNLEDPHIEADDILCNIISTYCPKGEEIVKIYKEIDKWYS